MGACGNQVLLKPAHEGHLVSPADKDACQVKSGVAISDHRNLRAPYVNTLPRAGVFAFIAVDPGQNRQAAVHTFKPFSFNAQFSVRPCPDGCQHRIEILFEGSKILFQVHGVGGFKLHPQSPDILKVVIQNFSRQPMGPDAIAQKPPRFSFLFKYRHMVTQAGQFRSRSQSGGPGTNDCHPFVP